MAYGAQKETAALLKNAAVIVIIKKRDSARAAGRTARTRLHSRKHEPLRFLEIDIRVRQHGVSPFLQKNLKAFHFEGRISPQGRFGYVHSQRGASAAGDHEDPHPVSGSSLLFHDFLELAYRAIRQTYHYFLLAEILAILVSGSCIQRNILILPIYSMNRNCFFLRLLKDQLFPFLNDITKS